MKSASTQRRSKFARKFGRGKSTGEISTAMLPKHSGHSRKKQSAKYYPMTDDGYWKERLLLRRYRFRTSGESEQDLAAYIDHAGTGYFFPLGTPDMEVAADKARQIYQMAVKQSWSATCRHFPRELIVSFEWCMNSGVVDLYHHPYSGRETHWTGIRFISGESQSATHIGG